MALRSLPILALIGCQPMVWPEEGECDHEAPPPGEVRAMQITCADQRILGGDGRPGDFLLANAWFSAVVRHPLDALTLAGLGGGTLVDLARWGEGDRLHEAAPLVGGGWLDVDNFEILPDGYRVGGQVRSLPDQPAVEEGARREVSWRIDPDEPILHLQGADGLWLHPMGGGEILDGQVVLGDVVYGHDGILSQDLGGALRLDGVQRLRIGTTQDAWAWRTDSPVEVGGEAPGAQAVVLWRQDVSVGRLPVDEEGRFHGWIPPEVDGVQARAPGRSHSERVNPDISLQLQVGAPASVELQPRWTGRPRQLWVQSRSEDGRAGAWSLPPEGGTLPLGEGRHRLMISAGPSYERTELQLRLSAEQTEPRRFSMDLAFDPGPRALVHIGRPSDRARTWRGADLSAALQISAVGHDYAVFAAPDDVAAVSTSPSHFPSLLARNGSRLRDRGGAWEILAWPLNRNLRTSAGGAPDVAGLSAEAALVVAAGGAANRRFLQVDLGWLGAVGSPHTLRDRPDFIRLESPGEDLSAWNPWFDWLNAGALLVPTGPFTWVEVQDPSVMGIADVEQGLLPGRVSAGTGALITLDVDGYGPGDVLPEPRIEAVDGPSSLPVQVEVRGDPRLDRVALVVDGERIMPVPDRLETPTANGPRWMIAVAWSSKGEAWATTGPLWLDPP